MPHALVPAQQKAHTPPASHAINAPCATCSPPMCPCAVPHVPPTDRRRDQHQEGAAPEGTGAGTLEGLSDLRVMHLSWISCRSDILRGQVCTEGLAWGLTPPAFPKPSHFSSPPGHAAVADILQISGLDVKSQVVHLEL